MKAKTNLTVKVDPDKKAKAQKKVDLNEVVRNAIDKIVGENACPCCGQKLPK